ncbi:4-(cytidine 5'-diphospho)-2-C-methyl-D-erythritol kinase [Patulibacter defluvii]|uniref:4-(cytidine 5'-diphospho)-2-C-methyl-D-erythritol kinase n=1 Tax=Patulibacter defluvii TaxID=3095358 RepID=UPI002A75238B|nr:hypothetical protein [Patulibacter sp. DM4]
MTGEPPAIATAAPAKVNATLVVGPVRDEDGRHELVTVMQSLTLADQVVLRPRRDGDDPPPAGAVDAIRCPGVEGDNLALRALTRFRAATGWDGPPQTVEIVKRIPVAAGMAGGSADAGAVLRLAAHRSGLGDPALLQQLAAGLGSDVPHQLQPGLAIGHGAGERVVRCAGVLPGAVVVVRADAQLATPAVYRRHDELDAGGGQRSSLALAGWLERITRALAGPAPPSLPDALCVNDLEPAAVDLCPLVGANVERLRTAGAQRAMVCGSGPTTIGWFDDAERARAAALRLREEGADALVATPTGGAAVSSIIEVPA